MIRPFKVVLDNDSEEFVRADSFNMVSVDCDGWVGGQLCFSGSRHTSCISSGLVSCKLIRTRFLGWRCFAAFLDVLV